ncbi:MAG TPA: hypothetical protein VK428_04370, partial [Acidimicrobiales bacterium]|nr:hypothetical protein [Acidimicrobiales bacterium]
MGKGLEEGRESLDSLNRHLNLTIFDVQRDDAAALIDAGLQRALSVSKAPPLDLNSIDSLLPEHRRVLPEHGRELALDLLQFRASTLIKLNLRFGRLFTGPV